MKIIQVKTHKIELTTNDFCDDYTSMLGVYSDVLFVEDRSFCVCDKSVVDNSAVAVTSQNVRVICTDLLQCTHEPNVSVPQLAGLLIERTQNTTWVVVYKSLISTHTIMNYGNEARFLGLFSHII